MCQMVIVELYNTHDCANTPFWVHGHVLTACKDKVTVIYCAATGKER